MYLIIFFCAQGTQFPKAEKLRKEYNVSGMVTVRTADSEIENVPARQVALKRWTATDKRWNRKVVYRGSVRLSRHLGRTRPN